MRFTRIFYDNAPSDLTPLTKDEYEKMLVNLEEEKARKALETAWTVRNFEIELYWKRANYFWAFTASTFVGYFALVNSTNYSKPDANDHAEVFMLVCIGFVLSVAWTLINKGSKQWQRNWEAHVDLLEDRFTGPLYKIVYPTITYSVSNINEIVSFSFSFIWLLLGIKYLVDQNLLNTNIKGINLFVTFSIIGVALAISAMKFGYGRGRFGTRKIIMHKRHVTYQ